MTPEQLDALVDVSASIILLYQFLLYVVLSVGLYLAWYGLRLARREMPAVLAEVARNLMVIEATAHDTARGVVAPPIRAASTWAGLRAAVRVLAGHPPQARLPGAGPRLPL